MLQELVAETGASGWAIASMFFFLAIWIWITVWVMRTPREELDARARLVLDGDEGGRPPGLKARGSGLREKAPPGLKARGSGLREKARD